MDHHKNTGHLKKRNKYSQIDWQTSIFWGKVILNWFGEVTQIVGKCWKLKQQMYIFAGLCPEKWGLSENVQWQMVITEMARGPPKLCQISRKSATKGWGWGQRPSIFLVWICCLLRRGWGLAWAPYSHRAPRFLVWHVTQVNIWLERILDSSTTHFDQVLPNKIFLKCQKYGIFYYYGAFWVGCGPFSSLVGEALLP